MDQVFFLIGTRLHILWVPVLLVFAQKHVIPQNMWKTCDSTNLFPEVPREVNPAWVLKNGTEYPTKLIWTEYATKLIWTEYATKLIWTEYATKLIWTEYATKLIWTEYATKLIWTEYATKLIWTEYATKLIWTEYATKLIWTEYATCLSLRKLTTVRFYLEQRLPNFLLSVPFDPSRSFTFTPYILSRFSCYAELALLHNVHLSHV